MNEKTILLEAFQPFAQYRNPFTFYYAQTYPLPPKSTIIGMLQNVTGRYYDQTFFNIEVNVQGSFESFFWNYQNLIKGSKDDISLRNYKGKPKLWNQGFPLYGSGITSQRSPISQQELFNGHIYIFLRGKDDLIEEIKQSLLNPPVIPYLGRSEDVIYLRNIYTEKDLLFSKKEARKNIWLTHPSYLKLRTQKNDIFPIKNEKFPVYSIPLKVIFKNGANSITNKAEITKSTKRVPKFETVMYTGLNQVIFLKDENKVKIENYKVKNKDLTFKIPNEFGWL